MTWAPDALLHFTYPADRRRCLARADAETESEGGSGEGEPAVAESICCCGRKGTRQASGYTSLPDADTI